MDRFYLQWNFVNWVTVVLMASFGAVIIAAISAGLASYLNGEKPADG